MPLLGPLGGGLAGVPSALEAGLVTVSEEAFAGAGLGSWAAEEAATTLSLSLELFALLTKAVCLAG